MKLLGGAWSRADVLALLGVFVAVVAIFVAHWDVTRTDAKPKGEISPAAPANREQKRIPPPPPHTGVEVKPDGSHIADVSSGEIGFDCNYFAQASTPKVFVGPTAREINATAAWVNTENSKNPEQTVHYDKNFSTGKIDAVYAGGFIHGLNTDYNCRDHGRATLTLHVTWSEDPPAKKKH